jgi:nicotinic acid mononucleotide adenylyltransferase
MGADNLASFDRWQHWRRIARIMPIAVADRPGWRLSALSSRAALALSRYRVPESEAASLADRKPPAWTFLTTRLSDLSSTMSSVGSTTLKPRISSRSPYKENQLSATSWLSPPAAMTGT